MKNIKNRNMRWKILKIFGKIAKIWKIRKLKISFYAITIFFLDLKTLRILKSSTRSRTCYFLALRHRHNFFLPLSKMIEPFKRPSSDVTSSTSHPYRVF